jgi:hypothetical protein
MVMVDVETLPARRASADGATSALGFEEGVVVGDRQPVPAEVRSPLGDRRP